MDSEKFCFSILSRYPIIPGIHNEIGVFGILFGLLYVFNTCLTVYWIMHQKFNAELGVERAARHVVFPAYVPFMWASACSDLFYAAVFFFTPISLYDSNPWGPAITYAFAWTFQEVVIEGVAFLLMQYGCGNEAAKRAGFYSFLWGIITFLVTLYFMKYGNTVAASILGFTYVIGILIFYFVLWLTPEGTLFRRDALRSYARFWSIYRFLSFISSCLLFASSTSHNIADCFYFFGPTLFYILCKPYTIYWALLADSIWWQGVYATRPMAGASRLLHRRREKGEYAINKQNLVSPLFGIEVAFNDAQELGRQVDVMRSEGRVKLLNFAYLSLDKKKMLGCGSYSKVYRGKYRGTPVAIKMLFTVDLNPEIIRRCCTEAQLLSDVSHPNVVEIFGVSVLPPSICIVLEICQYGSLSDVIRGSSGGGVSRRPLPLCHADRMFLALGCARGLQALHSHIPPQCHRDVKSFNFLVDGQLNSKIADLELGGDETVVKDEEDGRTSLNRLSSGQADDPTGKRASFKRRNKSSNRAEAFLSTWLAPEVLMGCPYALHSDIYSLGLVLWEIISGRTPYAEITDPDIVRNAILNGERPAMPYFPDKRYVKTIEKCWHADFTQRPVISEVVTALELCWEGSLHRHIFSTSCAVDLEVIHANYESECERIDYMQSMAVSFGRASSITSIPSLYGSNGGGRPSGIAPRRKQSIQPRTSISSGGPGNRSPHSDALTRALAPLKQEPKLEVLDAKSDASYMILTPCFPYIVLWVGKKWPQTTGFFLADIQCGDLGLLFGPRTDSASLRLMLENVEKGKPGHKLVTLYRRDGSSYIASLHGFPIFVKFPGDRRTGSDTVQLSSALMEGYISPATLLSSTNPQQQQQEEQREDEKEDPFSRHEDSLDANNSFAEGTEGTQNPLMEMASSNTTLGTDSKRLSSMSVSMSYPSAEIPNKVAYIAVQISAIQDLRF